MEWGATAVQCLSLRPKLSSLKDLRKLHAHMVLTGTYQDPFQLSKLIELAALSSLPGCFSYARELFLLIKSPNLFLYNTMIRGSLMNHKTEEAIQLYTQMRVNNLLPNNFTFPFLLRCLEYQLNLKLGEEVHGCILRIGFSSDIYVLTTLLNMYSVCCANMRAASKVFQEMPVKDVVSWNCMLSGCLRHGDLDSAKSYFNHSPNKSLVSWNSMLAGYASSGKVEEAERFFREMPTKDTTSWNSLISGYVKVGDMDSAEKIFDRMMKRDVVSWTIMIDGYMKNGSYDQCLLMFHQMQLEYIEPTEVTLLIILVACGNLGALELGSWVHLYINKKLSIIGHNLATALIDMYAKCGDMERGLEVFYGMRGSRDVIAWTAIISGLAMNGRCKEALEFFSCLVSEGIKPDRVTFLGVLSACSHGGYVKAGFQHFNSMTEYYNIVPRIEHYSCMVDLLGRSGLLEEAEEFVKTMPIKPDAIIWGSLFGACQVQKDAVMGERVMKRLLELDPANKENYVTLSNIYAATSRWTDVGEARLKLKEKGTRRTPGCSSIEVNYRVHEFVSRDVSHVWTNKIYSMLEFLSSQMAELNE